MELVGLQGVRAWNRIAIVIAFAAIAVFARSLDRLRASRTFRDRLRRPLAWNTVLAVVLIVGVLDQTSGALLPDARANEAAWRHDAAFVARLQRALPHGAMVFQLPVTDFPEHGAGHRMSDHDLIKEGYLHSTLAALERRRHPRADDRMAVARVQLEDARRCCADSWRWASRA